MPMIFVKHWGGGIICNFTPIFATFSTLRRMNLDHDFVRVSKLSEDEKKVFIKNRTTLFSPNSGEDQKKGLHRKQKTFFPKVKWTPTLRCTPESNYWRGCRCRPNLNYWGKYSQIIGGIYPSPRVLAPLAPSQRFISPCAMVTHIFDFSKKVQSVVQNRLDYTGLLQYRYAYFLRLLLHWFAIYPVGMTVLTHFREVSI